MGENSVVLLSTHIVEDVSELCTSMAIIDRGEILLEAEPLRAVDSTETQTLSPRLPRAAPLNAVRRAIVLYDSDDLGNDASRA